MIDSSTHKPVEILGAEQGPAVIIVPLSQLAGVTAVLDQHHVVYWVDEEVLSVDDEPEVAFVNLSAPAEVASVQALLDSIP